MFAHDRHQKIAATVERHRRISVAALQRQLGVSAATLRRDLTLLEQTGRIARAHGGVLHPDSVAGEPAFARKVRTAPGTKAALAATAAALIPGGATVFIDAGSTTLAVGRLLLARTDLTLFTNSLPLLEVSRSGGARLIALGGEVRPISRALVGGLAMDWLGNLRFDFAVIGASGLDLTDGASTTELMEATVKQAALARSRRAILVADATKWGRPASVSFAPWSDLDDWVTDHRPTRPESTRLTAQGVTLHRPTP
jgi:DeoR/GlpR family transcriptional regulator of sugar metabolism